MSKLPLIERLPSDVVESDDWLSNAFPIVEEDNGALSPFDLADIFPQPVETIPNTNSNNLIALASPQTTTKTSLGKHALASAEVAAVTTIAETTATATKKTTTRPVKKRRNRFNNPYLEAVREHEGDDSGDDDDDDLADFIVCKPGRDYRQVFGLT